jgi:hypothetical protein
MPKNPCSSSHTIKNINGDGVCTHASRAVLAFYAFLALLLTVPTVLTGNLWPLGTDASIGLTVVCVLLIIQLLWFTRVKLICTSDELIYVKPFSRKSVNLQRLVRVEYFSESHVGGYASYIVRLEDADNKVVRFSITNFSFRDLCKLARAIQAAVAAGPGGAQKHFVALEYIQNKGIINPPVI